MTYLDKLFELDEELSDSSEWNEALLEEFERYGATNLVHLYNYAHTGTILYLVKKGESIKEKWQTEKNWK